MKNSETGTAIGNRQQSEEDKIKDGFYTEIAIPEKKDEILELLKNFSPEVHTNADENFDWLPDGSFSIVVMKDGEEILYADLFEDELTLGVGGWHTHYAGYLTDYRMFLEVLNEFIAGRRCAVCIKSNEEWMGCFTAGTEDLSETSLVKEVNEILSVREFQKKLKEHGYRIECSFLDTSKNKVYEKRQKSSDACVSKPL